MMEEPSVLEYVLDKLTFWKEGEIDLPAVEESALSPVEKELDGEDKKSLFDRNWILLLPVLLALTAQFFLNPPRRSSLAGLILYSLAGAVLLVLLVRGIWQIPSSHEPTQEGFKEHIRIPALLLGVLFALAAFWMFGGNLFSPLNLLLWAAAFVLVVWGLWLPRGQVEDIRNRWQRFREVGVQISPWMILVLLAFLTAGYYRFNLLRQVPPEMFSDHAEKLLDVGDVLRGVTRIFFPRNTGREAFQMYLTAAVSRIFGTGLSFLSLKLGTTLAGFFTLPYIYLLGKEYVNRRVGLFALFLAGVAYWPNVISRVALRFTLYPFFAAPALYYFIRGMQRGKRNDFILAGIAIGLGLHGYSPFRIVPLIIVVAGILYALHHLSREGLQKSLTAVLIVGLISLIVFLPLLRFALSHYNVFSYRMRTRMMGVEHPLPGPWWKIFLTNTLKALVMFQWDNGEVWVNSIPGRPALGTVSAAFFTLGVIIVAYRYYRRRNWLDLMMLLLVPLTLLTSILALAFPNENPSLNRTGAAIIPVFILAAVAVDSLYTTLQKRFTGAWSKGFTAGLVGILFLIVASQNATLVFNDYYQQFRLKSWNTSDVGTVIRHFNESVGEEDHAWVIPYPHWVDTRLVGIRAGKPFKDYALWREDIPSTEDVQGPKLYIVKPEDQETLQVLDSIYSSGFQKEFQSQIPGRDFLMYYVFP